MEDPWANAWGDSPKPFIPEPSPLWAAPSVSVLHADNEDDSPTPSWPKGSVSSWSAEDLSADHIWSTEISSTSTFDEISIARGDTPQEGTRTEIQGASLPLHEQGAWALPGTRLQIMTTPQSFPKPIPSEITSISNVGPGNAAEERSRSLQPPISLLKSISTSLSEDVDGFGSFETGTDDLDKESWTPTNSGLPPISSTVSAHWDSTWQVKSEHDNNEQEDAWEAARRQKEKRDRHVPPELLSSILQQLEELSKDIWEDLGRSSTEVNDTLDFEMLGLNSVLTKLSPDDMTLPPTVPFAKTFTMKHMSDSLQLTRHYTSTRSSPMAMYLASKGSNSWEAAVKARPIATSDDVTPVGWKILNFSTQGESPVEDGKKKVGGIFSFFGRRTQNLSVDGNSKQSASPMTITGVSLSKTSTPRAGSPAAVEPRNTSERLQPAVPESPSLVSEVDTKSPSTVPTTDAAKDDIQPEPSAVSRFLGRIVGRSKTRSIDSLALSADDLKFLADVPTSSDNNGPTNEDLITILETPRPLPSRRESPLPKLPPPPSRLTEPGGSDDLLSLFDPTSIPNSPENSLTTNPPLPHAISSGKAASCQSTISNPSPQNRISFQEPAIKSSSSRQLSLDTVDFIKSSASRPTKEIKSDDPQVQRSSSTALPMTSGQVDDDEFSDFLSSPAVHNPLHSSSLLNNSSMPVPSIRMTDTHDDDFGEFGEAINDFSAPVLHLSGAHAPAVVSLPSTQSETVHARKKASRKADHSRTLSLLENAAARGRWLSPPSPIPEALSPPPEMPASSSAAGRDGKFDMQRQQSLAMAAYSSDKLTDPANAWRLPPPPSGTLLKPSVISSTPVHSRLIPPSRPEFVAQSNRSSINTQSGGLSAQDLSFFEGL